MRIAMVVDGLQIGGIERVCANYANLFLEMGYKVTVFNLNPYLTDMEDELPEKCKIMHVTFPRWLAPEYYAILIKKSALGKYIYPLAYLFMKVAVYLYRFFFRIAYKDIDDMYDYVIAFSGHVNDLTFVSERFVNHIYKIAWLHGALYEYDIISPAYMNLYVKIKNLVCLSELCDAEYYKFMKKNNIMKRRIYNPLYINEKKIDEKKVSALKEKYGDFCLMVARLDDDKDPITAIDAMRILDKKYGMRKKLLLVGDGKNMETIKKYAEKQNMKDQIILIGKTLDVQNYYLAASVYVHSSLLEGLPTVLLEAMIYGVAIAATDSVPGVREVFGEKGCGLVSKICEPEALADNIYELYMNISLRSQFIEYGKKRVQDFKPDVIRSQIQNYFSEIERKI